MGSNERRAVHQPRQREPMRMTVYLETRKHSHWYSPAESVAETAAIGSVELPGLTVNTIYSYKRCALPPRTGCRCHRVPTVFLEGVIPTARSFEDKSHWC